jgi:LacI family transcriptional regulator
MRDVAERAGVSFKTVSRVVNKEHGVSPTVALRVEHAIAALGYRPDDRARRLRQTGSRTGAIGFVLVDVANPFFSSILRGIEEVARQRECIVLSGSTDGDVAAEDRLVEAFVARRVDGLIVVPSGPGAGPIAAELDRGTPVVFLDLEPTHVSVDLVRSDHRGGAILATNHLLAHGHRDIAFFGDDAVVFSAGLRLEGFRTAMSAAGIGVGPHRVVTGRHTPAVWRQILTDYLRAAEPPTAIFTAQNYITVGAAQALHHLGLQHEIAHIGFDDVDLAEVVEPGISVVPQHPLELGRRAAAMLFRRIEGDGGPAMYEVLASDIIARGSGELRPR